MCEPWISSRLSLRSRNSHATAHMHLQSIQAIAGVCACRLQFTRTVIMQEDTGLCKIYRHHERNQVHPPKGILATLARVTSEEEVGM